MRCASSCAARRSGPWAPDAGATRTRTRPRTSRSRRAEQYTGLRKPLDPVEFSGSLRVTLTGKWPWLSVLCGVGGVRQRAAISVPCVYTPWSPSAAGGLHARAALRPLGQSAVGQQGAEGLPCDFLGAGPADDRAGHIRVLTRPGACGGCAGEEVEGIAADRGRRSGAAAAAEEYHRAAGPPDGGALRAGGDGDRLAGHRMRGGDDHVLAEHGRDAQRIDRAHRPRLRAAGDPDAVRRLGGGERIRRTDLPVRIEGQEVLAVQLGQHLPGSAPIPGGGQRKRTRLRGRSGGGEMPVIPSRAASVSPATCTSSTDAGRPASAAVIRSMATGAFGQSGTARTVIRIVAVLPLIASAPDGRPSAVPEGQGLVIVPGIPGLPGPDFPGLGGGPTSEPDRTLTTQTLRTRRAHLLSQTSVGVFTAIRTYACCLRNARTCWGDTHHGPFGSILFFPNEPGGGPVSRGNDEMTFDAGHAWRRRRR